MLGFFLLAVAVVLGVRIAMIGGMGFVHAFMETLGLFPGVLIAGSGGENEGGGAEEDREGLLHGDLQGDHPIARGPGCKWQIKPLTRLVASRHKKTGRRNNPAAR